MVLPPPSEMMWCFHHSRCRWKLGNRLLLGHSFFLANTSTRYFSKGEASLGFDKTKNNVEDLLRVRHETMFYAPNVGVLFLFVCAARALNRRARGLLVPRGL